MKIKDFVFLLPILLILFDLSTNNISVNKSYINMKNEKDNYKKYWEKVDSLENLGLPKSALEIVNDIYSLAIKNNNHDQIIKSTLFRMKYLNMIEENAFESAVYDLEKRVLTAKFPDKNMMHSILAEMYWMYYQNNRWKFYNRTQTIEYDSDDIKTWDLNKLADKVIKHYILSLDNADSLKAASIDIYDEVIVDFESTKMYRPTLFDFFAYRAIKFFKNKELTLTRPADKFLLQEDLYFLPVEDFINVKIETSDTLSLQYYGIKITQSLLKFRYSQDNKTALIKADLDRLEFVMNNSVNDLKDSLYLVALQNLEKKYPEEKITAEVSYLIANHYYSDASKYNQNDTSTYKFKDYYVIARNKCFETIDKYPGSSGAVKCQNLIYDIENLELNATVEEVWTKQKTIPVLINYKNVKKAYLRITKIDYTKLERLKEHLWGEELFEKLKKESSEIKEYSFELPDDKDYRKHSTEVLLDGLDYGLYIVFISNNPEFSYNKNIAGYCIINISDLAYISRNNNDGTYDFFVTDRNSGKPLKNIIVKKWISKYDYKQRKYVKQNTETYNTDDNGKVQMSNKEGSSFYIELINGDDHLFSTSSYYSYNYNYKNEPKYTTTIFTDRAIYRPGQTIYFKGITLKNDKEKYEVAEGYSVNVVLYDVNYQKVSELNLVTNEFGSFSGTFDIPMGLLNGQMQIYTSTGSKYISIEEYKRPKFETKLLPFDGNYILNDTVSVKGNAISYSGAYLTDAEVTYRIVRTPVWRGWWSWYWGYSFSETEIANGKTITNDKGEYSIKFLAKPDLSMKKSQYLDFNYKIYVDVTDINGETQSTQSDITIGYTSLKLDLDVPSTLLKSESDTFKIYTTNLNGEKIPAKGQISVFMLENPDKPYNSRLWSMPDKFIYNKEQWYEKLPDIVYNSDYNDITKLKETKKIFSADFNTDKSDKLILKDIKKWTAGRYKIKMVSVDAFGNKVFQEKFFTLFSDKDTKIPYNTPYWFAPVKVTGEPGEKAKFLIGSGHENVRILYQVENKNKIIEEKWFDINNAQKLIEVDIKEEYRGNFSVHFCFIKNNRYYSHVQTITVSYSNKELKIEFESFRNKLKPGEKEEWRIKISGKKGEKVAAEMLATLYDASLDQFKQNSWYFNIYPYRSAQMHFSSGMFNVNSAYVLSKNMNNYLNVPYEQEEYLNWFGFNYYGRYYLSYTSKGVNRAKNGGKDKAMFAETESEEEPTAGMMPAEEKALPPETTATLDDEDNRVDYGVNNPQGGEDKDKKSSGLDNIHTRSNFNETAFFYPNLQTNEKGEVIISFTIPESLTKWKMLGFAHTKDLKYGMIQNELITQKELMVVPNSPRFFRENDKIEFPVKINNLSEKNLKGLVRIEFYDALTMQKLTNIFDKFEKTEKSFEVKEKGNTVITWKLIIPEGVQAIQYKVVAKAGNYSDGEEKVLPVLTNRMLVTETLPLPIRGNQSKVFHFDKLLNSNNSKTLKHERYTLEFTSNPAWYAVQALPYLMEYPYECSEQVFSRFYANILASHIANSNPKIKNVFDSWKNTPDSKSLLSNLEKNQELKSVLLEETPWVLNAQDESERKRRVGLLFDLNHMANNINSAKRKLENLQCSNGGWVWFKGGPDDRYITQHIITGFGHLDHLGVTDVKSDNKIWNMVYKGIVYLDNEIRKDYNWLKKNLNEKEMEEDNIGYYQIQYLYARSFFKDVPVPNSSQEAFDYYITQAKKYWINKNRYMQGMIALALYRNNDKTTSTDIIKSIAENAIISEEMGMYWKDNTGGYYWYQAPIETQALMIEMYDEVAKDTKKVDDLKVWLLKQKQTQDWKTTKATVEAIYALLLKGTDLLASDQLVEIKIGDMKIDPKQMEDVKVEAGTGYFKTSWSGREIKPEMGNITVTKKDDGVAWGAVYWQYFEQLDKITPHETPLKMTKKLFIETNTESGKVIKPISDKNTLKVGDKVIVRIEIKVDRAMEYVHMKDMRASGFEPINVISRYKYQGGLGYYESTKDAATNFFISYLPKGTYVFEYPLRVQHKGDFSNGITSIQCMYAPEFASHSEGIRVKVE